MQVVPILSMFLAFVVRCGTLPFAHGYSPKTPQNFWSTQMARTVRDANLETRTARLRLPIRTEPYWRGMERGFALGYRRRAKGGTWLARRRPAAGGYAEQRIGTSDDFQDADGVAVLDYGQAQRAARQWWRAEQRREEGHDTRTGPYTVSDTIADYLKAMERRGSKGIAETKRKANVHILPSLGEVQVGKLTTRRIEEWHHGLADKPALARSKPGREPNHRKSDRTAEGIRKRRATANRVLTVLKAALNHAWKTGHVASDDAWRRVRPFKAVDTARIRYLTAAECVRIVNASAPAFRSLVRGALLTGCRYSELAAMHAADFNADAGVVTVRDSKAGKPRHVVLTGEGCKLFATLTAGKLGDEPIFTRHDGGVWRTSHQLRPMQDACKRAKVKPAISFHVLRHTHASALAMRGVPMGVIAEQLGHADTRMTEKHYAHLAPSYVADTIRAHFPTLGIASETAVVPLKRNRQSNPMAATRAARA
jgi:integrase